jgi:hypothetical protein
VSVVILVINLIFNSVFFLVYCKKSFEDDPDVTEEEIEEELGIIR